MSRLFPRTERIATPYLPIYAAISLAAGIWLGERLLTGDVFSCIGTSLTPDPLWLLAPLPLLLALAWRGRKKRRVLIPLAGLSLFLIGIWSYAEHPFEPCFGPNDLITHHAEDGYGRPRVMEGVVSGYPDQRESYAQYRVRVDTLWDGQSKLTVEGDALVRTGPDAQFRYGDRVRIRGAPATPPTFPDFNYRRFLARKGIRTLIRRAEISLLEPDQGNSFWAFLYDFRARASGILSIAIAEPCHFLAERLSLNLQCDAYAALANGMVLGIETGIPRDLYEQFNLTGTSHVIVISGSNIAIVSGLLLMMLGKVLGKGRLITTGLTLAGIAFYTLLVGADAAVTRAAIMGSLYVVAVHLERQGAAIVSLFFAALLMLLLNPLTLWDVGFQLSFMATLGLILFSQPLQRRWNARIGKRLPGIANNLLAEGLLITLAAQITTMPLVVFYFGRLSLISFLANLLILPVQPPIMIAGGLVIFSGLVFMPLAKLIALIPMFSLWWTVAVVQLMAAVPYGSIEVSAFGRLLSALYTMIFALVFLWWLLRQEQHADTLIPPNWRPALTNSLAVAAILVIPLWGGATWWESQPDGRMHIHLLGRENGAAFLIITPGGNRILLDPARESPAYPLDSILTSLPGGQRPADLHILTRSTSAEANQLITDHRSPLTATDPALQPGSTLTLDTNLTLTLLHTPAEPNDSLLFLLRYGEFSTLLPFENSQQTQAALLEQLPRSLTLLPAPYPGTGAWPHPDALARLHPQLILLPEGSTYPPKVQTLLAETGALAAIPNAAAIEIITDGRTFDLRIHPYAQDVIER